MKRLHTTDEARLSIMLGELRLPTIKTLWPQFAEQADKEGWPAARFLAAIAEHELAERAHRRTARHLA
ncbi:transposase [Ruegeria sp. TrichCH4B]|nr:transposase [Ruegeria sp. TrichCH4B]